MRRASPTRAVESLCRILSPFVDGSETAGASAGPGAGWDEIVPLACRHRLETTLASVLEGATDTRSDAKPPAPHVALFLEQTLRRNRERNARFREQAVEAVATLNAIGLCPVLLKGVHELLERPAEGTDGRWMADLDLLVSHERRTQAAEALAAIGYRRSAEMNDDFYGHHLPSLHRPGEPGAIELHWELATDLGCRLLPASEILESALAREASGLCYRLMPDDQRLAYLILHAQIADRHHYRLELPLRALNDFAQLAHRSRDIDWSAILERFRSRNAQLECGAFLALAHHLFEWPWPFDGEPDAAWTRHARRSLRLLHLPAGLARTIPLGDELRVGFSLPVLTRKYPDLGRAGPWALRRHHCGVLLRKYRGHYWARLAGRARR